MLAGATQRSDPDPYDKTSPPITVGPHWMIMWPFDARATGLPITYRDTGAYIMWAGSRMLTPTSWDTRKSIGVEIIQYSNSREDPCERKREGFVFQTRVAESCH